MKRNRASFILFWGIPITLTEILLADTFIPVIQEDIITIIRKQTNIGTITFKSKQYELIISPYTGRVWLDRNIGASRVCNSIDDNLCFGGYFQWGRNADGHEDPNSLITNNLATDITNAGNRFILSDINNNWDWSTADSDGTLRSTNWSKTDGSSVCPVGFRVPTLDEVKDELLNPGSAEIRNAYDAFNSFLKIPLSGYRSGYSATIFNIAAETHLFATSSNMYLFIDKTLAYANPHGGHYGYSGSVRCIRNK